MLLRNFLGGNSLGKATASGDTAFQVLVPPRKSFYTRITKVVYTTTTAAHVLTVMRPIGKADIVANAANAATAVTISGQPGTLLFPNSTLTTALAANDWIAIRFADGTVQLNKVSGTPVAAGNGQFTVTLTTALSQAITLGVGPDAPSFWQFGATTATDPRTGAAHPAFNLYAPSNPTTTTLSADGTGVLFGSGGQDEPILLYSNNVTAAGTLEQASFVHAQD